MRKTLLASAILALSIGIAAVAHADLAGFMSSLNVQAKADLPGFSVRLSTQFGIPVPEVQTIIKKVESPADAFMVLQVGQMAGKQPETVVETYRQNKGKGWGVIAKEMGIKPGSSEFHALKNGDLALTGKPGGGGERGHGKGGPKGKGHNK